jgi:predicted nucleic acid-binding protein
MIYLDSSVLLELYLGGPRAAEARSVLDEPEAKVASWLLSVEVPVVLRRALPAAGDRTVLARCLDRFDDDVADIGLVDSLTDVGLRVRSDHRFARCRALDAVHACTALLLREWTGHAVRLETFDARLDALARELNLRVTPPTP